MENEEQISTMMTILIIQISYNCSQMQNQIYNTRKNSLS